MTVETRKTLCLKESDFEVLSDFFHIIQEDDDLSADDAYYFLARIVDSDNEYLNFNIIVFYELFHL